MFEAVDQAVESLLANCEKLFELRRKAFPVCEERVVEGPLSASPAFIILPCAAS